MKKSTFLKMKIVLYVYGAIEVLLTLLLAITQNMTLAIIAVITMVIYVILSFIFGRCPYCLKTIHWLSRKYCSHCGEYLGKDPKDFNPPRHKPEDPETKPPYDNPADLD